ncbi:hypothetical protein LFX25_19480 [Leptospira sp. FAT2]|uniref:hypothetical protein n=1 Tax=Leptospira sanjuanensis TaxID=2879643 RepID=UPI001EE8CADF|nr:hypothetical protein [Leptospira sanjuanensis]MCG6170087.1 hypothetical protein [Leptospira sanjuanensis]MCG6195426.1 hypothetical protein [Leptospira sanjuanensis]
MFNRIPEAFLVILFTGFTYTLAFIFKLGKFDHYKIPAEFIQIDYRELIYPFTFVILMAVIILFFYLILTVLNLLDFKIVNAIKNKISAVSILILIFPVALVFLYYKFSLSIYYLIVSQFFSLMQISILLYKVGKDLRAYEDLDRRAQELYEKSNDARTRTDRLKLEASDLSISRNKKKKITKAIEAMENDSASIFEEVEKIKTTIDKSINLSRALFLFGPVLSPILLVLLFYNIGQSKEIGRAEFSIYKEYILIDLVNKTGILKKYNKINNTIDKDFFITEFPENQILEIKTKTIGRLTVTE